MKTQSFYLLIHGLKYCDFLVVSPGLTVTGMVIENQTCPRWEHSHLKSLSSVNSVWGSADIHLAGYARVSIFVLICPDSFMCHIPYECQASHTNWRHSVNGSVRNLLLPCNWIAQNCTRLLLSTRWCKDNLNYWKENCWGETAIFLLETGSCFCFLCDFTVVCSAYLHVAQQHPSQ